MVYLRFKINVGPADQVTFTLTARTGQVVLAGRRYTSRAAIERGIASVRASAPLDERYERRCSGRELYFVLTDADGEILGTSETFSSVEELEDYVAAIKAAASTATIEA